MKAEEARNHFILSLQMAYSGELGAAWAYIGHRNALRRPRHADDRALIARILRDEVRHRKQILVMLEALGAQPDPRRERKMTRVGRTIACFCRVGGWFMPMYGAARLEKDNIVEYEIAAQLAWRAELSSYVDELLELAEVEWDHELWLRERAASHWMWKVIPSWEPPPPRDTIRARFDAWQADPSAEIVTRKSMLR